MELSNTFLQIFVNRNHYFKKIQFYKKIFKDSKLKAITVY